MGGDSTAHGTVDAAAIKVANTLEASTVQVGQTLSVGGNLAVKGTIEAAAVTKAGIPINLSQWATGAKGISYSGKRRHWDRSSRRKTGRARRDLCGDSDLYFTQTGHRHTGRGNAPGQAAIENVVDHNALMILGRSGAPQGRAVKLWDYLQVNGTLDVTGRINGQLSGLDVAPNFSAVVRCADFLIGGVGDLVGQNAGRW